MSISFANIMLLVVVIQAIGTLSLHLQAEESVRTDTVYIGWPHIIMCDPPNWDTSTCKIADKATGAILYQEKNPKFQLDNVTEDTPTEYVITYEDEKSGRVEKVEQYILNVEHFHGETIQQSLEDESLHFVVTATIGSRRELNCAPVGDETKRGIWESLEGIATCTWYYNGTEIELDGNVNQQGSCRIQYGSVKREQFGVYSCAVNHNGQSMIMVHHDLCYNPQTTDNMKPIVCPAEPFKAKVGENITIPVKAIMGNGSHYSMDMVFYWRRPTTSGWLCYNYGPEDGKWSSTENKDESQINSAIQCQVFALPTDEPQCTMDIASINPEENFETAVETHLIFNNVTESNFGVYRVQFSPSWELPFEDQFCYITLTEDTE